MSVGGGALRGGHHLLKDFSITTDSKAYEALTNQVYYGTSGVTSNVGTGLTSNLIASS